MTVSPAPPILDPSALERIRKLGGEKLLARMVELCLDRFTTLSRQASEAADRGDGAGIAKIAHALRSSAGNVGAMRFSEGLAKIEQIAENPGSDLHALRAAIEAGAVEAQDALRKALADSQ